MAHVLFFGRLRDAAGCREREVGLDRAIDLTAFRRLAAAGNEDLETALAAPSIRVAINAALAPQGAVSVIEPNDEVAFMPPFSGG